MVKLTRAEKALSESDTYNQLLRVLAGVAVAIGNGPLGPYEINGLVRAARDLRQFVQRKAAEEMASEMISGAAGQG